MQATTTGMAQVTWQWTSAHAAVHDQLRRARHRAAPGERRSRRRRQSDVAHPALRHTPPRPYTGTHGGWWRGSRAPPWSQSQCPVVMATPVCSSIAVGTALAGGPPRRSQRALLTHWAPALGIGAKAHVGKGMHHAGRREPSCGQAVHSRPAEPRMLAATLKRLVPEPGQLGTKGGNRRAVAGHSVVGAVAPHHARQPPPLLGDGLMPPSLELVFDLS